MSCGIVALLVIATNNGFMKGSFIMIYIPAQRPEDWKPHMANGDKQWQPGYSAMSLAETWQNTEGFPKKVKVVLQSVDELKDFEMLQGIPEYKVSLPGGGHASQNDLFVLAGDDKGLCAIMVEGKVDESFGPFISEWKKEMSQGKKDRFDYLVNLLQLPNQGIDHIRYQLLYRTASAVITAKSFHCNTAMVLVHSFSSTDKSFDDYAAFLKLYALNGKIDGITGPIVLEGINTYWGWVKDN